MNNLFLFTQEDTKKLCSVCNRDPGRKVDSILWNVFFDADTKTLICFSWRANHYYRKSKTKYTALFTELPVIY